SDFAGWTATGNQAVRVAASSPFPLTTTEGTKALVFNGGDLTPNGTLSQTFTTTPGNSYNLTFDVGASGFQTTLHERLQVSVQDSSGTLLSQILTATGQGTGTWWSPEAFSFVA